MERPFLAVCLSLCLAVPCVQAGDDDNSSIRKEFHEGGAYPYVFTPGSYLVKEGPPLMRFGPPANECAHHNPPGLPAYAKPTPSPSATPKNDKAAKPSPTPSVPEPPLPDQKTQASSGGGTESKAAYLPPEGGTATNNEASSSQEGDMTKMPDEVMDYFKNPYNSGVPNPHRFFDPIFEPAYSHGGQGQANQGNEDSNTTTGPQSHATYHQE